MIAIQSGHNYEDCCRLAARTQARATLNAAGPVLALPVSTLKITRWPSVSLSSPESRTTEICTYTSAPGASGAIKPNPRRSLKNLTRPDDILALRRHADDNPGD